MEFPSSYPSACLLGCVEVTDVLAQENYREIVSDYPRFKGQATRKISFSSGKWPSYLMNLLSLRLVGAGGARINVSSSYSKQELPGGAGINVRS